MFTGIVERTGTLRAREARGPGARLVVACDVGALSIGESIAVHGACLTVVGAPAGAFETDASAETLARTTLGTMPLGARVHLERALCLGDALGGHLVTGHVDGRARLLARDEVGDSLALTFAVEPALARYVAPKGSVALDGVSLTVNAVRGDRFDVVIIPHTLAVTALGDIPVGGQANVEVDLVARYVARLLEGRAEGDPPAAPADRR